MRTKDIKTAEPFISLLPIDMKTLAAVMDDMKVNRYDLAQPVILVKYPGSDYVVGDGHTRVEAALNCGIEDIPVIKKQFPNEDAAVAYAIHCQRDRRNVTDADLARWILDLDKRRTKSEAGAMKGKQTSGDVSSGPSSKQTAETVGTSSTKVEKVRAINDHASPETKKDVLDGKKSINKAYKETQAGRRVTVEPNMPITDRDDAEPKGRKPSSRPVAASEKATPMLPLDPADVADLILTSFTKEQIQTIIEILWHGAGLEETTQEGR